MNLLPVNIYNITHWPELGINYWAINKNATSTIKSHFLKLAEGREFDDTLEEANKSKKYLARTRFIYPWDALSNDLKNFAVTRNPYTRFESCYKQFKFPKSSVHSGSHKGQFNPSWTPNEFLLFIYQEFKKRKESANKHFQQQTWFIEKLFGLPNTEIIKLESLKEDWPFGFSCPEYASNISSPHTVNYDKKLLYSIYEQDFKKCGYSR